MLIGKKESPILCGRFENTFSLQDLILMLDTLDLTIEGEKGKPENIAPTEKINSIMPGEGGLSLLSSNWGIQFSPESPLIFNTRIETIKEKGFWKGLYDRNRCLVPMTGFYEWKKSGTKKTPYRIHLPDEPLFFVAALYNLNKRKEREISLITTTPNEFISKIHHRMPVIIPKEGIKRFFTSPVEENIEISVPLQEDVKMEMEPAHI